MIHWSTALGGPPVLALLDRRVLHVRLPVVPLWAARGPPGLAGAAARALRAVGGRLLPRVRVLRPLRLRLRLLKLLLLLLLHGRLRRRRRAAVAEMAGAVRPRDDGGPVVVVVGGRVVVGGVAAAAAAHHVVYQPREALNALQPAGPVRLRQPAAVAPTRLLLARRRGRHGLARGRREGAAGAAGRARLAAARQHVHVAGAAEVARTVCRIAHAVRGGGFRRRPVKAAEPAGAEQASLLRCHSALLVGIVGGSAAAVSSRQRIPRALKRVRNRAREGPAPGHPTGLVVVQRRQHAGRELMVPRRRHRELTRRHAGQAGGAIVRPQVVVQIMVLRLGCAGGFPPHDAAQEVAPPLLEVFIRELPSLWVGLPETLYKQSGRCKRQLDRSVSLVGVQMIEHLVNDRRTVQNDVAATRLPAAGSKIPNQPGGRRGGEGERGDQALT